MLSTALARPRPGVDLRARRRSTTSRASSRADAGAGRHRARRGAPARQRRHAHHLRRHARQGARGGRAARRGGHRGRGDRPARAAAARRRDDPRARSRRTHRAVVVDEGWRSGSLAAEVSARIMEERVLRARRAGRPRVQRRGADAVRQAPRGRGAAPGRTASWPRSGRRWPAMAEFRMPSLGADMERGHARRVAGQARRRGQARRHRRGGRDDKAEIEVEIFEDGVGRGAAGRPGRARAGRHAARDRPRAEAGGPAERRAGAPRRAAGGPRPAPRGRAAGGRRRSHRCARRTAARTLGVAARPRSRGSGPDGADPVGRDVGVAAAARRSRATAPDRAARGDARGDRRGDGPLEARDPALLPGHDDRHDAGARRGSASANRSGRSPSALLPAVLLAQGRGALACGEVPELNGFWVDGAFQPASAASTSASRSRCAAAAWSRPRIHDADRLDSTS